MGPSRRTPSPGTQGLPSRSVITWPSAHAAEGDGAPLAAAPGLHHRGGPPLSGSLPLGRPGLHAPLQGAILPEEPASAQRVLPPPGGLQGRASRSRFSQTSLLAPPNPVLFPPSTNGHEGRAWNFCHPRASQTPRAQRRPRG